MKDASRNCTGPVMAEQVRNRSSATLISCCLPDTMCATMLTWMMLPPLVLCHDTAVGHGRLPAGGLTSLPPSFPPSLPPSSVMPQSDFLAAAQAPVNLPAACSQPASWQPHVIKDSLMSAKTSIQMNQCRCQDNSITDVSTSTVMVQRSRCLHFPLLLLLRRAALGCQAASTNSALPAMWLCSSTDFYNSKGKLCLTSSNIFRSIPMLRPHMLQAHSLLGFHQAAAGVTFDSMSDGMGLRLSIPWVRFGACCLLGVSMTGQHVMLAGYLPGSSWFLPATLPCNMTIYMTNMTSSAT